MQEIPIRSHEGRKYLRTIYSAETKGHIQVDVYAVLEAFRVTCPARAHAVKKMLCCGTREKGDTLADLYGALAAINRAIELEKQRLGSCGDGVMALRDALDSGLRAEREAKSREAGKQVPSDDKASVVYSGDC